MSQRATQNRARQVYSLDDLSAGLHTDANAYNLPEGAARICNNVLFNLDKSISVRPGAERVSWIQGTSLLTAQNTTQGLVLTGTDNSVFLGTAPSRASPSRSASCWTAARAFCCSGRRKVSRIYRYQAVVGRPAPTITNTQGVSAPSRTGPR